MSRRSLASLVAVGLLLALVMMAARTPVPYVKVSPGPTVDVLGDIGGEPIVQVEGHKTFPTKGELRLTTVSVTSPEQKITLVDAIGTWMRSSDVVMPFESMYPEVTSNEQERAESAAQMVNSQDTAIASALTELGYDLPTYAEVTGISPGGPSDGTLKARDRIVEIDGARIKNTNQIFTVMGKKKPGDKVSGVVLRGKVRKDFSLTTEAAPDDPDRAVLGILIGTGFVFPFDVKVDLGDSIGGPSAGLMFSLSVFDTLTPGALTGGNIVAGTGTIAADGSVGPIGHIRQKIVGAKNAGAKLFFVPPDNCPSAILAPVDADEIRLVRADTMHSAVDSLEKYAADPSADLPRCPE